MSKKLLLIFITLQSITINNVYMISSGCIIFAQLLSMLSQCISSMLVKPNSMQ